MLYFHFGIFVKFLQSSTYKYFFNNYVSLRYIHLSLCNRVATFLGCHLCLPYVLLVAVLLYLSVFPFNDENLMCIWLDQLLSSLIYFDPGTQGVLSLSTLVCAGIAIVFVKPTYYWF